MDKSNTVRNVDSHKKFLSLTAGEGRQVKVHSHAWYDMLRMQNITILFFLWTLSYPSNRFPEIETREPPQSTTILWFPSNTRSDPPTCLISQGSLGVRMHRMRKKGGGWNRFGAMQTRHLRVVGVHGVPHSAGNASHCSAWQTCCVGTGIGMGVTAEGNPATKASIVNTLTAA